MPEAPDFFYWRSEGFVEIELVDCLLTLHHFSRARAWLPPVCSNGFVTGSRSLHITYQIYFSVFHLYPETQLTPRESNFASQLRPTLLVS